MRKAVVDSFEDNGELVVIELEDKTTIAVPKDKFICGNHRQPPLGLIVAGLGTITPGMCV